MALRGLLPPNLQIIDWTVDNASYFSCHPYPEKTDDVADPAADRWQVAAFNIVAMLVMTVTDKAQ